VSRTYQILLAVVVALGAVGGYWKLVLSPKREQAAQLDQQVAAAQAQLAQTQQLIATYTGAKDDYKSNYDAVVRLGKAVPNDDDTKSLIVQLDAAAKRSGVAFNTLNLNSSGGGSAKPTGAVIPGAVSVGAFSAMPFSLSFDGRFDTLGSFLSRLERFVTVDGDRIDVNGRLLRIESLSLTPGESGWPALNAEVGASSYIVPETATAAAGSGNSAVASTPSAGTTSASTTATSTSTATDLR
jgi:Tfp pilus assembly protein PilO